MDLREAFRVQADACRELGSPMYGALLDRAVEDIDAGGPTRRVLAGHEDDPGPSALALRLLGSVHRLVLSGRAPALAAYYPSVGGRWVADAGWAAFRRLLEEQPDDAVAWLDRAPQTNEVGRSSALYGGLLQLPGDDPVRLFEIGASAGLNLLADRFGYTDDHGRRFGHPDAALVLHGAWRGRPLTGRRPVAVVERAGCDLRPVDAATPEGRLSLTAYVWPDQAARLERLRHALAVAAAHRVTVHAAGARTFVEGLDLAEGATTVLWHSVMWQYLSGEDKAAVTAAVERLGRQATPRRRLAHLRAEQARRTPGGPHEFLVHLRAWPGGEDRLLGTTTGHGLPTTWQ